MPEFGDGFPDIIQGKMVAGLIKIGSGRGPAQRQLLERAHIDVAVMKIVLQLGHMAGEEAAVVPDGIAAHGRNPLTDPLF